MACLVHAEQILPNSLRNQSVKERKTEDDKRGFPEKNWGTYYDPKEIFCGEYDCYKILDFDYETWGRRPPTRKELTQSYRHMSKIWHPDKNKDKGAKDRFLKINKAYEVLTNSKLRKEYDHMRERPDDYFKKYGSTVLYHYAPKSDTAVVIIILLTFGCAFTWFAQKQKWQHVANKVIKDAVDGLRSREGGSSESIQVRQKAEIILRNLKEKEPKDNGCTISDRVTTNGKTKSKSKVKMTKKEIKEKEKEELRPLIVELVNEFQDFGAGFHQPTWRDLLIFKLVNWPFTLVKSLVWETKYYIRRMGRFELNVNEREILTKRAVGDIAWTAASVEGRDEMLKRELWVMSNFEEWQKLVELRQLNSGELKRLTRYKKKRKENEGRIT